MGCGGSIKCEKELFIISLMNFYSCSSRLFICAEEELEGSGCLTTGRRGGGPSALWPLQGGNIVGKRFIVKGFLFYFETDFIMQSWTISPRSR